MLKIKDNVDLKELEKFGFKLFQGNSKYYYKDVYNGTSDYRVYVEDRIIQLGMGAEETIFNVDTTIYDLIQAGIVEKVEK